MASEVSSAMDGLSEAGTEASSKSGSDDPQADESAKNLNKRSGWQEKLNNILYPLYQMKLTRNRKYALCMMVMDYLQLSVFIIEERQGWKFDYHQKFFYYWTRMRLDVNAVKEGYDFYLAWFYTLVFTITGIILLALLSVRKMQSNNNSSFLKNRTPFRVKVLRLLLSLVTRAFFTSSLQFLLTSVQCYWETRRDFGEELGDLMSFKGKSCIETPYIIHGGVAIVYSAILSAIGFMRVLAEFDNNPLSEDIYATAHAWLSVRVFLAKLAVGFAPVLLSWHPKLEAFVYFSGFAYIAYNTIHWAPFYMRWVNYLQAMLTCMLTWGGFMCLIKSFFGPDRYDLLTTCLAAGAIPTAAIGYACIYFRMQHARRVAAAFARDQSLAYTKDMFRGELEPEMAARCVRQLEFGQPVDMLVDTAEALYKAGVKQFPDSIQVRLAHANFLLEVQSSSWAEVQAILADVRNNMKPCLWERFQIFARMQEMKEMQRSKPQNNQDSTGEVLNYAEFQQHFRVVVQHHKAALKIGRKFWREMAHRNVKMQNLASTIIKIAKAEDTAQRTYHTALELYPTSVKLLRAYGHFLEEIKMEPSKALKLFGEAEKLEETQAEERREAELAAIAQMGDANDGKQSRAKQEIMMRDFDYPEGVMIINRMGEIKYVNKKVTRLFGYKKDGLEGRNVSMLMPQPFSGLHNSFLQHYCMSGIPRILDSTREVVAIHRDRSIFPMGINVCTVDLGDEDGFCGVFRPKLEDPSIAVFYCNPAGTIICANKVTTEMLGYQSIDLVGKRVHDMLRDGAALEQGFAQCLQQALTEDEDSVEFSLKSTMQHKWELSMDVAIQVRVGGTSNHRILLLSIKLEAGIVGGVACFDNNGRLHHFNNAFADILLFPAPVMLQNTDIRSYLPQRYATMHTAWMNLPAEEIAARAATAKSMGTSKCTSSKLVYMTGHRGAAVPVSLTVRERVRHELKNHRMHACLVLPATAQAVDAPRCLIVTVHDDGMIQAVNSGARTVGLSSGHLPEELVGLYVSQLVRVVDHRLLVPSKVRNRVGADPDSDEPSWLGPCLAAMIKQQVRGEVDYWRASLKVSPDAPPVPAVMELMDAQGGEAYQINITRQDHLEGFVEVDETMTVTDGDTSVAMLWGNSDDRLAYVGLDEILPSAAPSMSGDQLVGMTLAHSHKSKRPVVGNKRSLSMHHADNTMVNIWMQAGARSKKKVRAGASRFLLHISGASGVGEAVSTSHVWGVESAEGDAAEQEDDTSETASVSSGTSSSLSGGLNFQRTASTDSRGLREDDFEMSQSEDASSHAAGDLGKLADVTTPKAGFAGRKSLGDFSLRSSLKGRDPEGRVARAAAAAAAGGDGERRIRFAEEPEKEDDTGPRMKMGSPRGGRGGPPGLEPAADGSVVNGGEGGEEGDDEDGSAYDDVGDSASVVDTGDEGSKVNYGQQKRLRKARKFLASNFPFDLANSLPRFLGIVWCVMLLAHIGVFTTMNIFISDHGRLVDRLDKAGKATSLAVSISSYARILASAAQGGNNSWATGASRGLEPHLNTTNELISEFEHKMADAAEELSEIHHGLFLGFAGLKHPGEDDLIKLYEDPIIPVRTFTIHLPGSGVQNDTYMGLWELGNRYCMAARQLSDGTMDHSNAEESIPYRFVMNNGVNGLKEGLVTNSVIARRVAKNQMALVVNLLLLLLVFEGGLVVPLCVAYLARRLRKISMERHGLFSTLINIPRRHLVTLASKKLIIDDKDGNGGSDDESSDDEGWSSRNDSNEVDKAKGGSASSPPGMFGGKAKAGKKAGTGANSRTEKTLENYSLDFYTIAAPLLIWAAVVAFAYSFSYFALNRGLDTMNSLNVADYVSASMTVTRHWANELVLIRGPNVPIDGPAVEHVKEFFHPDEDGEPHRHLLSGGGDPTALNEAGGHGAEGGGCNESESSECRPSQMYPEDLAEGAGVLSVPLPQNGGGSWAGDRWRGLRSLLAGGGADIVDAGELHAHHGLSPSLTFKPYTHYTNLPLTEQIATLRGLLFREVDVLMKHYHEVVYGPHFEETVHGLDDIGLPGALFLSMGGAAADHLFRNDGCMRLGADRGTCLAKDQLYYPTVTDGLDVLISEFSERGRLLAKDSALDLHLLNERFKFLWQVSEHDAAGGLATHTQLYVDQVLAGGKLELLLASMMLAVFIGGSIGYYNFMIKPFVKKTEMQQHRVAQLLAQLPDEVSLSSLLNPALRAQQAGAGGGAAAAAKEGFVGRLGAVMGGDGAGAGRGGQGGKGLRM